jgi:hypothetical protein
LSSTGKREREKKGRREIQETTDYFIQVTKQNSTRRHKN